MSSTSESDNLTHWTALDSIDMSPDVDMNLLTVQTSCQTSLLGFRHTDEVFSPNSYLVGRLTNRQPSEASGVHSVRGRTIPDLLPPVRTASLFTRSDDSFVSSSYRPTSRPRHAPVAEQPTSELLERLGLSISTSRASTTTTRSSSSVRGEGITSPSTPLSLSSLPSVPQTGISSSLFTGSPYPSTSNTSGTPSEPFTPARSERSDEGLLPPHSIPRSYVPLPRLRTERVSLSQRWDTSLNSIREWCSTAREGFGSYLCELLNPNTSEETRRFSEGLQSSGHIPLLLDLIREHYPEEFEQWMDAAAMKHMEAKIATEMNALTSAFHFTLKNVTPDHLLNFSLEKIIQPLIDKHSPSVDLLMRAAVDSDRSLKENTRKNSGIVCLCRSPYTRLYILNIFVDSTSHHIYDGQTSFSKCTALL